MSRRKPAPAVSQPCHHSRCEGECILTAVTDRQIQLAGMVPSHHADTPHPHVETRADRCRWSYFLFSLGFIHFKVRLGGGVDMWARDNPDRSVLKAGGHPMAHETEKTAAPHLSGGVPFRRVPNGLHYIRSNGMGTRGEKRWKTWRLPLRDLLSDGLT